MSRVIAGAYENGVVSANMIYLSEEDIELRRKELAASGKRLSLQDKKVELSSTTVAKFVDKGLMGNGEHLLEVFFTDEGKQCLLSLAESEYKAVLMACAGKGKSLQESSFNEQVKPKRRSRTTSSHSTSAVSDNKTDSEHKIKEASDAASKKITRFSSSSVSGLAAANASLDSKWWHNSPFVITMLIVFFPIGLGFLWLSPRFSKITKAIVSACFVLIIFIVFSDAKHFINVLLIVFSISVLVYVCFSSHFPFVVKIVGTLAVFTLYLLMMTFNFAYELNTDSSTQSQQQSQPKSQQVEENASNTPKVAANVSKQNDVSQIADDMDLRRKIATGAIRPLTKKDFPEIYRAWGRSYVKRINKELMTQAALTVAKSDQCNVITHVGLDNERSTIKKNAIFDVLCLNGNRFYVAEKDIKAGTEVKPYKGEDKWEEMITVCEKAAKQRLKRPDTFERRTEPPLIKTWGSDNRSVTFGFTVIHSNSHRKVDMYARCMFNRHGLYEVKVNQGHL